MRTQDIHGGFYGDVLPSGEFAVTIPQLGLSTHLGVIALPPGEPWGIGYPRITRVGGFQAAGQAHSTNNLTLAHMGAWMSIPGPCVGVSPVIFNQQGQLIISNGSVGSQGYRYVREDGSIATGDETYGPWHGLSQWSEIGAGLFIGQCLESNRDEALIWTGTTRLLLEPQRSFFIRANRDGEQVAISLSLPDRVRLIWTTLSELRALPEYRPSFMPSPPSPVPHPEPLPMSDVLATLKTERAKYPARDLTRAQLGALLNAVAYAHRAEGVGLQRKDGGFTAIQPRTGILIASDVLRFPGNIGRDVLGDADGACIPAWGDPGPADPQTFVAPVEPFSDGPDIPIPSPPPSPVPVPLPQVVPYGVWMEQDVPQLAAAYRAKHGTDPAFSDGAHQAYRRFVERWTLERMLEDV